jgi:hypothetical protein
MSRTLTASPEQEPPSLPGEFDIEYLAEDGTRHKVPLAEAVYLWVRSRQREPHR